MFNLTIYCRRTLNTIPPEGRAERPLPAAARPVRPAGSPLDVRASALAAGTPRRTEERA